MALRFVVPKVIRIPLTDGDWIEVREYLNTGEQKALESAGSDTPIKLADGTVYTPVDWVRYELERASIFLLDWSLRDVEDRPVPLFKNNVFIIESLKALDPLDFQEINGAIIKHVMDKAAEKNARRAALIKQSAPPSGDQIST